jgi:hypothetical protein
MPKILGLHAVAVTGPSSSTPNPFGSRTPAVRRSSVYRRLTEIGIRKILQGDF